MAELTIDASEITKALERHVEDYTPAVGTEQIGRIVEVGDGIARVSGLPGAAVNELLEFEDGTLGLALNLDEDTIGAVVLGEVDSSRRGTDGQGHRAHSDRSRSATHCSAAWSTPSASRSTGKGPDPTPPRTRRMEVSRLRGIVGRFQPVQRAHADGHQGH